MKAELESKQRAVLDAALAWFNDWGWRTMSDDMIATSCDRELLAAVYGLLHAEVTP